MVLVAGARWRLRCKDAAVEDYPELASLDEDDAAAIVSEWRPANLRWTLLTPSV